MINTVNSGISIPPPPRTKQNFTEEQQVLLSDTLSEFDVEILAQVFEKFEIDESDSIINTTA